MGKESVASGGAEDSPSGTSSRLPPVRATCFLFSTQSIDRLVRSCCPAPSVLLSSPIGTQGRIKAIAQQRRDMGALANDAVERMCT